MQTILIREIKKRMEGAVEIYSDAIGTEIRLKRIALGMTLQALSDNVCSVSYLCKLEKNDIKPNRAFLREICERLKMNKSHIDILINLKEILDNVIEAYFKGDSDYILKVIKEGNGLENYRFKLIEFIYNISINKYEDAYSIYKELVILSRSMPDFELYVFSLFSGILSYKFNELDKAYEILNSISFTNDKIELIRTLYLFYIRFSLNSTDTVMHHSILDRKLYEKGLYKELESVNYLMAIYMIRNNCKLGYLNIVNRIKSKKYKTSISFLDKFINNKHFNPYEYSDKYLTDYCMALKLISTDINKAIEFVSKLNSYSLDYNQIHINYLLIEDKIDRVNYIVETALPHLSFNNNQYFTDYFLCELAKLSKEVKVKDFKGVFIRAKCERNVIL